MNHFVTQLLEQPQAYLLIQQAETMLNEEQKKRADFYSTMNEEKVEFINGEIIINSPAMKRHCDATKLLAGLLDFYVRKHNLGFVGVEKIMISLTRNDYEPDICFFGQKKAKDFKDDQLLFPAPDFVVEVLSKKTEKKDRGIKFEDYQAHGVQEYWIIDPKKQVVEQYHLVDKQYKLIAKLTKGAIKSFAISGFEIPVQAIFDEKLNMEVLGDLIR